MQSAASTVHCVSAQFDAGWARGPDPLTAQNFRAGRSFPSAETIQRAPRSVWGCRGRICPAGRSGCAPIRLASARTVSWIETAFAWSSIDGIGDGP